MRESRADTVQATLLAIGLHVLLFAIALMGLWWTRSDAPVSAAGPVIEAELIDPNALSASMRRVLSERPDPVPVAEPPQPEPEPVPEPLEEETAPPLQPEPEPAPQDSPVPPQPQAQERLPEPDTREQERVSAQATAEREAREREQEARRRQEQIDLTERQRQEEAERRQRLTEMELQRRKQLEDIRKRRAEAAREAEQAEKKLRQLQAAQEAARADAAASASPPPGNEGDDTDLRARYAAALQEAILRNWTRPDNVPLGQRCRIVIRQIPGGEVIGAEVDSSCPYDEQGRRSVEAAVLKAQPLPYAGFEKVFNRTLNLNFQAQDR